MKITYYGHACFGVTVCGKHLLFDPFITPNQLAAKVNVSEIPADYILISHGHEDHVADTVAIAQRTQATVIANFEIVTWFQAKGIKNGHPMNHGGKWNFDFGSVKFVYATHSSVMPDGVYGGNPGGFVVETAEGNFYYSGDTGLTMDMQLIPQTCAPLQAALLPIGSNFTMDINEALLASDFVKCNKVIGLHYDTFGYIKIDHKQAVEAFKAKGKELILLPIGTSIDI